MQLPSPVGEGAELAEADEVSAVPTAKLDVCAIKFQAANPDGVICHFVHKITLRYCEKNKKFVLYL